MLYKTDKIKSIYQKMTGGEKFRLFKNLLNKNSGEIDEILRSFGIESLEGQSNKNVLKQKQLTNFIALVGLSTLKDACTLQLLLAEQIFETWQLKSVLKGLTFCTTKIMKAIEESDNGKEIIEKINASGVGKDICNEIEDVERIDIDNLIVNTRETMNILSSLNEKDGNLGFIPPEIIEKMLENSVLLKTLRKQN